MRDNRLDPFKVHIGRGFGRRENGGGVEDVQPLIFHRAHVEVIHGNDVEQIKIVFTTINVLVPFHTVFQRLHAKGAFAFVTGAHIEVQVNVAAGFRGEAAGVCDQIARDQSKQVGRLGPGIMPFGGIRAAADGVAVGQQYRMWSVDGYGKHRHHIGAVGVIGDLAKAFRLALGAIHAVRHIKPLKRGIAHRVDLYLRFPDEGRVRHSAGQPLGRHLGRDGRAINHGRDER